MSSQPEKTQKKKSRSSRPQAAEQVIARNVAVDSIYRKLIGLALIATLAAIIAVVSALSLAAKKVPPQFVPVLPDGRMLPLVPLDKPNMSQALVADFALEAVRALNTYDYINWISQFNEAQRYFSPQGWKAFDAELQGVATMKAVESRKMVVSVRPTGDVRVVWEGVAPNGTYVWKVEVPVSIKYTAHIDMQGGSGGNKQEGVATLTLSRVPTTNNPRGIAIQAYKVVETP